MGKFAGTLLLVALGAISGASYAQTFTSLVSFTPPHGTNPAFESLVRGLDGNFYGTTNHGGGYDRGTVFKLTSAGLVTLHVFTGSDDGGLPVSSLILQPDGSFSGTTQGGGNANFGVAFKITPSGDFSVIFNFTNAGACTNPSAALLPGPDGSYFATGLYRGGGGFGCAFQFTPGGTTKVLHDFSYFDVATYDGAWPAAPMIQLLNGTLIGTTQGGASEPGYGEIYTITKTAYTILVRFNLTNGAYPSGALLEAADGNLYGTTAGGGAHGSGTVFQLAPNGRLTTLYSFNNSADGAAPNGALIQATDGNLYGTTAVGGTFGYGTVFEMTTAGVLTTLHSFNGTDGASPLGTLLQNTNGDFYGVSNIGGQHGYGTVFKISTGLGPFVTALPTHGPVGSTVHILGNNLTSASSVTFNGLPADFAAGASTFITATVPAGPATGVIQVVTADGTLTSNVPFRLGQ